MKMQLMSQQDEQQFKYSATYDHCFQVQAQSSQQLEARLGAKIIKKKKDE